MILLDGKKLSEKILNELRATLQKSGKKLRFAGILVGDDKSSQVFLRQKEKACQKVGIDFKLYQFSESIANEKLMAEVEKIVAEPQNNGIIIQLPLPKHIKTQEILNLIPPQKDIDVLSEKSKNSPILAPVLAGILDLFKEYHIDFKAKKTVVVGKGRLVGKPITAWLKNQKMDFLAIDSASSAILQFTKEADILISGVGKSGLITGQMVKKGAIVVDASGDVDFESVSPKASHITPVRGGIGPMTVAEVIKNLIILNEEKL